MTKKDFKAIALIISESLSLDNDQKEKLAREFASYLCTTNPRFNRLLFISACANRMVTK